MIAIIFVSFLIAGLFADDEDLQMFYRIPSSVVKVFRGIILLLCVLGGDIFVDRKLVWEKK